MILRNKILEKNLELVEAIKCSDTPSEINKIRIELNGLLDTYLYLPVIDSTGINYPKKLD